MLHNLCTDVWTYISLGYFAQVRGQGTVGSSTMPHKVNPIRFENAEANLEVSSALLDVLGSTLVTSACSATSPTPRCSATSATAFGHSLLALDNVLRGLAGPRRRARGAGRRPRRQLGGARRGGAVGDAGPRRQGVPGMDNPYERLKELTRGRRITGEDLREFVPASACLTTSRSGSRR